MKIFCLLFSLLLLTVNLSAQKTGSAVKQTVLFNDLGLRDSVWLGMPYAVFARMMEKAGRDPEPALDENTMNDGHHASFVDEVYAAADDIDIITWWFMAPVGWLPGDPLPAGSRLYGLTIAYRDNKSRDGYTSSALRKPSRVWDFLQQWDLVDPQGLRICIQESGDRYLRIGGAVKDSEFAARFPPLGSE